MEIETIRNRKKSFIIDFGNRILNKMNFSKTICLPKQALKNLDLEEGDSLKVELVQDEDEKFLKLTPVIVADEEEDDDEDEEDEKSAPKKYTVKKVAKTRKGLTAKSKFVKGADIPAKKDRFTIQIISKKQLLDAQNFADKLIKSGYDAYIQKAYFKETEEIWYRVRIGSYDNYNSAQAVANIVSKDIKLSVWVDFVRLDK